METKEAFVMKGLFFKKKACKNTEFIKICIPFFNLLLTFFFLSIFF